jgi:hypothetical protein
MSITVSIYTPIMIRRDNYHLEDVHVFGFSSTDGTLGHTHMLLSNVISFFYPEMFTFLMTLQISQSRLANVENQNCL